MADPTRIQHVQVSIDALVIPDVIPFWREAFRYEFRRDTNDDVVDPRGRWPSFWFQQMDAPRPSATVFTSTSTWLRSKPKPASLLSSPPAAARLTSITRGFSPTPEAMRSAWARTYCDLKNVVSDHSPAVHSPLPAARRASFWLRPVWPGGRSAARGAVARLQRSVERCGHGSPMPNGRCKDDADTGDGRLARSGSVADDDPGRGHGRRSVPESSFVRGKGSARRRGDHHDEGLSDDRDRGGDRAARQVRLAMDDVGGTMREGLLVLAVSAGWGVTTALMVPP